MSNTIQFHTVNWANNTIYANTSICGCSCHVLSLGADLVVHGDDLQQGEGKGQGGEKGKEKEEKKDKWWMFYTHQKITMNMILISLKMIDIK